MRTLLSYPILTVFSRALLRYMTSSGKGGCVKHAEKKPAQACSVCVCVSLYLCRCKPTRTTGTCAVPRRLQFVASFGAAARAAGSGGVPRAGYIITIITAIMMCIYIYIYIYVCVLLILALLLYHYMCYYYY